MKRKLATQLTKIANYLEKISFEDGGFGDNIAALLQQVFGNKLSQEEIGKYSQLGAQELAKYLKTLNEEQAKNVVNSFLKKEKLPSPIKNLV